MFSYTNTNSTIENLGLINVYIDALSSEETDIGGIAGNLAFGIIDKGYATGLTDGGVPLINNNGLSTQDMYSTSSTITGLGNQFFHFTGNSYPKLCVTPLIIGATCTSADYVPCQ